MRKCIVVRSEDMVTMKGFHVEMLFGCSGYNGTKCLGWYHGTVQEVVNENTNRVRIKWDAEYLGEDNVLVTDHKLVISN